MSSGSGWRRRGCSWWMYMPSPEPVSITDPMLPAPHALFRTSRETPDTFTLIVHPQDGMPARGFLPGQFSMLWAFGVGEAPISMSGDPTDTSRLVYTIRSVGHVSRALISMRAGGSVGVRGPFG